MGLSKRLKLFIALFFIFTFFIYLLFILKLYYDDFRYMLSFLNPQIEAVSKNLSMNLWDYNDKSLKENLKVLEKNEFVKTAVCFDTSRKIYFTSKGIENTQYDFSKYKKKFFYILKTKRLLFNKEMIGILYIVVDKTRLYQSSLLWLLFFLFLIVVQFVFLRKIVIMVKEIYITQTKDIEKLQEHFINVIQSSPNPVVIIDKNFRIIIANGMFDKTLKNDEKMFKDDFLLCDELKEMVKLSMKKNDVETLLNKNIGGKIFDITVFPEKGFMTNEFVIIQFTDVTEKTKLERKYLQAQKMETVGILAGGVAHDFNNMLAGMYSYVELLAMTGDEKKEFYIEKLRNVMERAKELVRHLLVFTRHSNEQKETVYVKDIIEDSLAIIESTMPKNITVSKKLDEVSDVKIHVEKNSMVQVILNILINAVEAIDGRKNGRIELAGTLFSKENDEYVAISITDNGPGIPEDVKAHIFDPFFTTKHRDNKKGTGLGLAVVYDVINRIGGIINLYSEVGEGTTFKIYLPVCHECFRQKKEEIEIKSGDFSDKKILIIDDEPDVRETLIDILSRFGYEIDSAENGKEGIEKIVSDSNNYDLIILDWIMPVMNGNEVLSALSEKNVYIPVIISSGFVTQDIDDILNKFDFVKAKISKPFSVKMLISIINSTLLVK